MTTRRVLHRARHALVTTVAATALATAGLATLAAAPAQAAPQGFDLWAESGSATMPNGQAVTVWGYQSSDSAASRPGGPTLQVTVGDDVSITLHNRLGERTGLLVQGQSMVPDLTGVAGGGQTTYTFVADRPGTYLYEAAPLPNAQHQSAMGLYGAFVVLPATSGQAYPAPDTAYDADSVLLLGELDPALSNAANPASFDMRLFKPRFFLVNGQAYPDTPTITGAGSSTHLLRYVNAGMSYHSMGVLGAEQTVIALDGSPLRDARHYVAETIGPGQTADALLEVPAAAAVDTDLTVYDASMSLHNSNTAGVGGMLTTVQVPGVSSPTDTTGPVVRGATVQNDVLTATADDGNGHGGSSLAAVEYVVDATGGSATAMNPVDTAFDSAVEDVTATVPAVTGNHVYYVRGRDQSGNWGPFTSVLVSGADQGGPTTREPQLKPNLVKGTNSAPVDLSATADDSSSGNSPVAAAEFFIDTQGTDGTGNAMTVSPAAAVASIDGTIPPATLDGLSEGSHAVYVHAQDSQGNWGEAVTVNLTVDESGPLTTGLSAVRTPNNGTVPYNSSIPAVRVIATTMTDPISGGVNSQITDAEAFLDTVGANGTGIRLTPSNGVFVGTTEGGYTDIPLSTVTALSNGPHTISVHAKDAAGNWGPISTTTLTVDKTKPTLSGVSVTPNPTLGATSVTLTATATDPAPAPTGIARVEWWRGTDPGVGKANAMTLSGSGPTATASATIDVSDFGDGTTTLRLRVQDAAGNWSAAISSVNLAVRSPLYFSTFGNSNPPGVAGSADDSDLYRWDGAAHSRAADLSSTPYNVPTGANVDGLTRVDATHFYLTFADDTTLPGLGPVQDEDVVYWNGSAWSVYFNGTAHGLTNANLDVDAISVSGTTLSFSTAGNSNPPGVGGTADDADIYRWDGTSYARVWDATANGVPAAANVDGYDRVDGTHFYLSFAADTTVTGVGAVQDEDVVYVDGATRSVYFDGTAHGLTSANLDVDAFDVP